MISIPIKLLKQQFLLQVKWWYKADWGCDGHAECKGLMTGHLASTNKESEGERGKGWDLDGMYGWRYEVPVLTRENAWTRGPC